MNTVFIKILNMSIAASWLIAVVLLLRPLLRKAPRWISCILWALVALRLVIPFTFESALSVVPSSETISVDASGESTPKIRTGIPVIDERADIVLSQDNIHENSGTTSEREDPKPSDNADLLNTVCRIGSIIWCAGVLGMLLWGLISFLQIRMKVRASVRIDGRVMACDEVSSPFILGVIRPRIYVPSDLRGAELDYALAHEEAHIKRRDHWWKPLGFLILSVYWFNPLCWVAYILLCRDIEFACDEKVVKGMGGHHVKEYSRALLDLSLMRRRITACPLAFGEMSVKQRVRRILNYKKPAFWVIIVSLVVCAAVAVCFLTDPKGKAQESADEDESISESESQPEGTEDPVTSEDPIDQAILLSLKLSQENPDNPLLSAVTPQRSEAILTAMRTIPIEAYPELWERCCTEVAYRAQKLAGMEQFLNISLEYGLYDPWAQEQWYLRFTEMKASLPAGEVTKENALRYGNLLLPLLEERLKGGSLGSGEWAVLQTMIQEASEQFDFPEKTVSSRKEALDWFAAYENLTNAIRQIIANDYVWTPRSVEDAANENNAASASEEEPSEAVSEPLYGSLSPEEEAAVCQVAMEHIYEVFDEVFPKERRAFEKEDLIAVVDPAVHWGECFSHGVPEWMEYTEKYGLKDHSDRVASVSIEVRLGAEGSTQGYSVFLVKPLETDTWIIVNYGF